MTITGVKADEMQAMWPHVAAHFQTFADLSKDEVTVGELLHQVLQGHRQCWVAMKDAGVLACVLTEIVGAPVKAVQISFAAGRDRHEWRDAMVREIENWGRSRGATRSRVIGRPGWAREMKDYRDVARVIEKELAE